jgi:hypothetical protein
LSSRTASSSLSAGFLSTSSTVVTGPAACINGRVVIDIRHQDRRDHSRRLRATDLSDGLLPGQDFPFLRRNAHAALDRAV